MYFSKTTGGFYTPQIHDSMPEDAVEIPDARYAELLAGQNSGKQIVGGQDGHPILVNRPAPTFEEAVKVLTRAIQAEMDRRAQERGYDDIVSACSYAAQDPGAPFQAEGRAFLDWRSQVWVQAYAVQEQVKAGLRSLPTPAQAVAAMPPLVLP